MSCMRTENQLREVFNQAFDALPSAVRSRIESLWRQEHVSNEVGDGSGRFHPPILKEGIIPNRNMRPRPLLDWTGPPSTMSRMINAGQQAREVIQQSRGICGQTDSLIFRFKTAVVDEATDDILKTVIAHDLAHAYRAAEAERPFPEASLVLGTSEIQEEDAANALMAQWGFDLNALLVWLQQNETKLGL